MKRLARPELTAAEAARIGEEIREARLALGITIEDAANRLRINRRYLAALEEGRIKDLPGPAYAMGFVRSYASALGLDADELVRRFRDVTGTGAQKGDLVFPEPVPGRGIPAGAVVGIGAVLVVAGYIGWYNWSGTGDRAVDTVPPLPPRLEETAQVGERLREQEASTPAPTPEPAPPPQPAPETPRVSLRAKGDTTIQIRDARDNNRVILDRVLRTGDAMAVPNRDGLLLNIGQAQNLEIVVEGQPSTVLGNARGARHGLSLDVDRLRPRAAGGQGAGRQQQQQPSQPTAQQQAQPPAQRPASQAAPANPAAQGQTPAPQPQAQPQAAPPRPAQTMPAQGQFVPYTGGAARN